MDSISVVVPCYNGERFLLTAVDSILGQTLLPDEIIIVDDLSSDRTLAVAEELKEKSPIRVKVIALPSNSGGPAEPINVGVRAAAGQLVCVLDQDDVFLPRQLESLSECLNANADAAMAFSLCGSLNAPEVPLVRNEILDMILSCSRNHAGCLTLRGAAMLKILLMKGNFVVGFPGFMFRRDRFLRLGGLDLTLRIAADFDMICKFAATGPVGFSREIGYLKNDHGGNACNDRIAAVTEGAVVRVCHLDANVFGDEYDEAEAAVSQHLRGAAYWFRRGGRLRESRRLLMLGIRKFGIDWRYLVAFIKLLGEHIAMAMRLSTVRPSPYTDWRTSKDDFEEHECAKP